VPTCERSWAAQIGSCRELSLISHVPTVSSCPYAHRARIALKASGTKFEIVEIDLQNKPEWYAPNINPASKVRGTLTDASAAPAFRANKAR
jgi:hypothetical protein